MSNVLIVESENDKYFIEALIKNINLDIEIGEPICTIDEYECLGGIGKLEERLRALTHRIIKGEIDKVGIIFDADKVGIEKRIIQIQEKINLVKRDLPNGLDKVEFVIYIQNKDGNGELETVLKEIKSKDSTVADCLGTWQDCLPDNKKLNQKDFDKFWIQIYQRYDCCTKKEVKQAGKKCNNKASLTKGIYDFDRDILNNLKKFLKEIGEKDDNTTSN
ncbi:hypothetical protein MNB_SV-15-846 [hydrothermal vent metagenome]|uniref:DUF4276 family protein n=1 Tax=hydrothermal vent metagenome TaxID=652676 RepID=A0A1W1EK91_9ZZZZ